MPDYRLMPDICTLTASAKKLGIVCPYPMCGTSSFITARLEQKESTCSFRPNPHVLLGGNQTNIRQKNLLDVTRRPAEIGNAGTSLLQLCFGSWIRLHLHSEIHKTNSSVTHCFSRLSAQLTVTGCFTPPYQEKKVETVLLLVHVLCFCKSTELYPSCICSFYVEENTF